MTEQDNQIDVAGFIPLLAERIHVQDPCVREFLVGWVSVLASVPGIDLLPHLPHFLEGLFKILAEPHQVIRPMCDTLLAELLAEIKDGGVNHIDLAAVVQVLVDFGSSEDAHAKVTAVTWLSVLCPLAKAAILPFAADIVSAVLVSLSPSIDTKLRELALSVNQSLTKVVSELDCNDGGDCSSVGDGDPSEPGFDLVSLLGEVTRLVRHRSSSTRIAALRWILTLHASMTTALRPHVDSITPLLLAALGDRGDDVMRLNIETLAEISTTEAVGTDPTANDDGLDDGLFRRFLQQLLAMFKADRDFLQTRGPFILHHLLGLLDPARIFRDVSEVLAKETSPIFISTMVDTLNQMLMSSESLAGVRAQLMRPYEPAGTALFRVFYNSWSYSPAATVSLCFLAHEYEHARTLIEQFGEFDIGPELLEKVTDVIVSLESPSFSVLRMHLLEPTKHPHLVMALYGLLMLVPQNKTSKTLANRLDSLRGLNAGSGLLTSDIQMTSRFSSVDRKALLRHFLDTGGKLVS